MIWLKGEKGLKEKGKIYYKRRGEGSRVDVILERGKGIREQYS